MNERAEASRIVARVEDGAFAQPLLGALASQREIVRAHVIGSLRWQGRTDHLIEQLSDRRVGKIDRALLRILRLALHELMEMRSAQHAVVSEWVTLARREAARASGFANAVLRRATRENLQTLLPAGDGDDALAVRYSHPLWMVKRWIGRFGRDEAIAILRENQNESRPDLLVDPARMDEVRDRLRAEGIDFTDSKLVHGMLRLSRSSRTLDDLAASGAIHGLDEASAAVAMMMPQSPGVLDVAAAPGSKSLVLRARGISVISADVSLMRTAVMRNLLGRSAAPRVVTADGNHLPFRRRFASVLLDAPCSATGTVRKNPELKWRLRESDLEHFAKRQAELLRSSAAISDGWLLYSTCSLEAEENDDLIRAFLDASSDYELVIPDGAARWFRVDGPRVTISPSLGTDGFTVHLMRRRT